MAGPSPAPAAARVRGRWRGRRLPLATGALLPVLGYSLLSLSGPLAAGRGLLVTALVARLLLGVLVFVLVRGRRKATHLLAVGYLLLVLVTGVLDREYDALLVLVSGLALVLTLGSVLVGLGWRPRARSRTAPGVVNGEKFVS